MGMSPGLVGNLVLPPFYNPDKLRSSLHASDPKSATLPGDPHSLKRDLHQAMARCGCRDLHMEVDLNDRYSF